MSTPDRHRDKLLAALAADDMAGAVISDPEVDCPAGRLPHTGGGLPRPKPLRSGSRVAIRWAGGGVPGRPRLLRTRCPVSGVSG